MITYDNRVVNLKNNFIRFLGNMAAQEVDLDTMRKGGEQLQAKLDNLIEEELNKGQELKLIPDLLDLRVLSDKNVFTDELKEALSMSIALSDNAAAMVALGFDSPNTYADFNVASAQISQIPKKVAFRLYQNLILCIKEQRGEDDLIDDIIFDACRDQIAERMSFTAFAEENNIDCGESEETLKRVQAAYNGRYSEWFEQEVNRVLSEVISNPMVNVIVRPCGLENVKDDLRAVCPDEAAEWIDSLTADDINSGTVFEKLMNEYKLGKAQLQRFARSIEKFMSENQTSQSVQMGGGQNVNPFYSVNMASIILHAIIMASAELWNPGIEQLSESTEYILDLFREELTNINCIECSTDTPYRMLSAVSVTNSLPVSQHAFLRASAQDYLLAQGAITMMIQMDIAEKTIKEKENE